MLSATQPSVKEPPACIRCLLRIFHIFYKIAKVMTERLDLLAAEFMVTQLDGGMHSALSAEAGSGVAYKGMERRFVATSEIIIQDERLFVF